MCFIFLMLSLKCSFVAKKKSGKVRLEFLLITCLLFFMRIILKFLKVSFLGLLLQMRKVT